MGHNDYFTYCSRCNGPIRKGPTGEPMYMHEGNWICTKCHEELYPQPAWFDSSEKGPLSVEEFTKDADGDTLIDRVEKLEADMADLMAIVLKLQFQIPLSG